MGIGAASAEGAQAGAARRFATIDQRSRPWPGRIQQIERAVRQVDQGIDVLAVQRPVQNALPHGEQDLDQSGDAGRGFGMADIRFDRSQTAMRRLRPGQSTPKIQFGERCFQAFHLDRIAERRSGSVAFDHRHRARIDPGLLVRLDDQTSLGLRVGRRQRRRRAAMALGRAADHAEDVVAVAFGEIKPLEQDRADAVGPRIAVGVAREGLATAVGADHSDAREQDVLGRGQHQIGPARDRHFAAFVANAHDGAMHGDQRTRAGGIDDLAWTVDVEQERQTVGAEGMAEAGQLHRIHVAGFVGQVGVVLK
ncbi:MAG TPA: hypothetical protein VGH49_14375, partial [Xanthobacteraceae bacterium]